MIAETLFVVRKPLTTRPLHYIGIQPITWSLSHTCSTERNVLLGKKLLLFPVYDSGLTAGILRLLFQSTHRPGQTVTREFEWDCHLPPSPIRVISRFLILTCVMSTYLDYYGRLLFPSVSYYSSPRHQMDIFYIIICMIVAFSAFIHCPSSLHHIPPDM